MKRTTELIYGLPQKELLEKIHFHHRQGEVADRALGFYLLDMERRGGFEPFSNASLWAEKHLGFERADKLILLSKRLEDLPEIEAAFDRGEVPWTKIREIARVATPETEGDWLELARQKTSREIEQAVAGVKRGDRPGGGLKARRKKYVERFPLSGEEKVIWDQGFRKVLSELPQGATPADSAVEMARRALLSDPEGKTSSRSRAPGRKAHGRGLFLVVYHVGRDGKGLGGN